MTDHELEQRMRTALEHAAPDRLDRILSSCGQQNRVADVSAHPAQSDGPMEGAVMHMSEIQNTNHKPKRRKRTIAALVAAAAVFAICIGGYSLFQKNAVPAVDSVVTLDVNPSLSLYVDGKEKVLSAEALNADAEAILGSMELKDTTLEVAVNAIIGSMLQKGYLGDLQNTILVSIENEDVARGEALQQKVTEMISAAAQNGSLDAAILSQLVSADDAALLALAQQYGISVGKAALIQEVIAQAPTLTFEELATMTINEIALLADSRNVSGEHVTHNGTSSDKAYIGGAAAYEAALAHAGVAAGDVLESEVELDSDDHIMIYEVEFKTGTAKYEYEINATTGEIMTVETKQQNHTAGNGGSGSTSYIGNDAALAAALQHAGVAASSVTEKDIELERKGSMMVYEVEFKTGRTEYYYEINAATGDILKAVNH